MAGDTLDELTTPSYLRITKKQAINVGDHDLLHIEGFCEHSDIENDLLPTAGIAGGSNVIESDTGDWYFFVESLQEWQKRLTIGEEE